VNEEKKKKTAFAQTQFEATTKRDAAWNGRMETLLFSFLPSLCSLDLEALQSEQKGAAGRNSPPVGSEGVRRLR